MGELTALAGHHSTCTNNYHFYFEGWGKASLEKTKGETEACFYRQWKYLCVQANLFLTSSPIRYVCSTSTSQFNFVNLRFTNFHGIYFIFSSFFRLFMQFSMKSLNRIPNKQLPLAHWQKSVLAFMLKACLHSSDSLPISFVSHGLERPQVLGHVRAERSCQCESGICCYKFVE